VFTRTSLGSIPMPARILSRSFRRSQASRSRLSQPLDRYRSVEDFNLDHLPSLRRDVLAHLATGMFVAEADNVILLGSPRLGKTRLAIGLGIKAAQAGNSVLFDTASNWIARLATAHHRGQLEAELKKIRRYKLIIIIDEVGYIPFGQDAAKLFFRLVASRYEQGSIMVTSNLPFGRWGDVIRRRRRRSDDRQARPPRRSPHPHRRLLPHPPASRAPLQRAPRRQQLTRQLISFHPTKTAQNSADVDSVRGENPLVTGVLDEMSDCGVAGAMQVETMTFRAGCEGCET